VTTGPENFAQDEQLLPGLEPPSRGEPAIKVAARRTITALEAAGFLDERHAVICQLILDLAEVVDAGRRQGKASAAAMAAAQLLAAYTLLMPEANEGGGDDDWSTFVADLRRSATEVRDAARLDAPE